MADVIERGDIYFFYRPAEGESHVHDLTGVQRFFTVLKPEGKNAFRALVIGQKKLPERQEEDTPERRYWGFVDRVVDDPEALKQELMEGARPGGGPTGPPRPVGEGVYAIARHENHTDLAYKLEFPETPGDAQHAFHIDPEASYVLSIKNPSAGSPPGQGLDREARAHYPPDLQARFGDHRWVSADPADFLDHPGAEFLLIGTTEAGEDVGVDLEAHAEGTPDVLRDLHLERESGLTRPLFEGAWE